MTSPAAAASTTLSTGAGRFGVPAVLVSTVAWGTGSVVVKLISATGVTTVMVRLWLAIPVAVALLAFRGRRPTWLAVRRCIPGGILFGLHVVLFFTALRLTSVANVTFIGALQPAIVLLVAGRWLGEQVTARIVGLSIAAIGGVALIVYGNTAVTEGALVGDLLAVANILVWTVFFLYTKKARDHVEAIDYQATMTVVAAAVVTPLTLALGADPGEIGGWDWFWLAFVVLVPGTLGHLLMNWAHRYVDATVSSLVILGVPVIAAATAAVVLDEPVTAIQVVGAAVVLGAIGAILRRHSGGSSALAEAVAEADNL